MPESVNDGAIVPYKEYVENAKRPLLTPAIPFES